MADTLREHVAACGRWNNCRRSGWHTRWQALHDLYRMNFSLTMHVAQCHAPCPGCARVGVACTLCRSVPLDGQGHGRLDRLCMPHRQRCSAGCREEAEAGKILVQPCSRQAGRQAGKLTCASWIHMPDIKQTSRTFQIMLWSGRAPRTRVWRLWGSKEGGGDHYCCRAGPGVPYRIGCNR